MRLLTTVLVVAMLFIAATEASYIDSSVEGVNFFKASEYASMFQQFIAKFKKSYSTSSFAARLKAFTSNINLITQTNKLGKKLKLGVTQFSDLTVSEFRSKFTGITLPTSGSLVETENMVEQETEADIEANAADFKTGRDWRSMMTVPPHQHGCGSCWAFAAAATVEGARAIAGISGKQYISTQQLVDCAKDTPCRGCRGGWFTCAFSELRNGYYTDADIPYQIKDLGSCSTKTSSTFKPLGKIKKFDSVPGNDKQFLKALSSGPIWTTLNADILQNYASGIVTSDTNCSKTVNHAVVAVGYAQDGNISYYYIRNSWGESWGEQGHFRLQAGACGLYSNAAARPIL